MTEPIAPILRYIQVFSLGEKMAELKYILDFTIHAYSSTLSPLYAPESVLLVQSVRPTVSPMNSPFFANRFSTNGINIGSEIGSGANFFR
jgi:hypothetical protein